jgi:hypothetical protein
MTIIQEENSNTSRRRVVELSEFIIRELKTILSPRLYQKKKTIFENYKTKMNLI